MFSFELLFFEFYFIRLGCARPQFKSRLNGSPVLERINVDTNLRSRSFLCLRLIRMR